MENYQRKEKQIGKRNSGRNRIGHRFIALWSTLSLFAGLLGGCGAGAATDSRDISGGQDSADSQVYVETRDTVDWLSHTLVQGGSTEIGEQWYLSGYGEGWIAEPEQEYSSKYTDYTGFAGDFCAYTQYVKLDEDGDFEYSWYEMDYFDSETMTSTHVAVDREEWGMPYGNIGDMDIIAEKQLGFTGRGYDWIDDKQVLEECVAIWYDLEQGMQGKVDLMPLMAENNVVLSGR